jgi:HEAT repeat protein
MFLNYILERDWLDDTTVISALRNEIVRRGELAVNPLLALLTHSDWAVRDDVARMLGYLGDIRAVDALLVAMMKDENEIVQKSAVEALLRIGTPKALALVNTYQNFLRKQEKDR